MEKCYQCGKLTFESGCSEECGEEVRQESITYILIEQMK